MRTATGRAVLDATFLTGQAAPTLSSLVGRVVAARALGAVPEPAAPAPYPAVLQPGGPRRSRAAWANPARCSVVAAH